MPPKAAAAPVPESVLKKQAATKKSAEDRAKQQAARKQASRLHAQMIDALAAARVLKTCLNLLLLLMCNEYVFPLPLR